MKKDGRDESRRYQEISSGLFCVAAMSQAPGLLEPVGSLNYCKNGL